VNAQQDQDRKMLELLDHELDEAFQRQEAQLELSVRLIFAPTGLKILAFRLLNYDGDQRFLHTEHRTPSRGRHR
jgi:hypothetical protein